MASKRHRGANRRGNHNHDNSSNPGEDNYMHKNNSHSKPDYSGNSANSARDNSNATDNRNNQGRNWNHNIHQQSINNGNFKNRVPNTKGPGNGSGNYHNNGTDGGYTRRLTRSKTSNGSGNGSVNSYLGKRSASSDHLPPAKRAVGSKGRIFSGEGPHYRGDGSESCFDQGQRDTEEARPFSSAMPFSIREGALAQYESDYIKTKFSEANPDISGETFYMDFIQRAWAQKPDKPLSRIHRSYGLKAMLEYGDVNEISAEVFHFLCGIFQCKYGDNFMSDDMVMCDCDGKVPRCFTTAYIEMARRVNQLEQQVATATALLAGKVPLDLATVKHSPVLTASSNLSEDVAMSGENIG